MGKFAISIDFTRDGNSEEFTTEGWTPPNVSFTFSAGRQSSLAFATPRQGRYRFTLQGWPLHHSERLPSQRMLLFINYRFTAMFLFDGFEVREAVVDLPPSALAGLLTTVVTLRFPDASSPAELGLSNDAQTLGMAVMKVTLQAIESDEPLPPDALTPSSDPPAELTVFSRDHDARSALFRRFESLGHNCEFGVVQRAFDIHVLGLLRFTGISVAALAELVEGRLEEAGQRGNLRAEDTDEDINIRDVHAGFMMHSNRFRDEVSDMDALLDLQHKRLTYMVRNMVEAMRTGDRIFVFRDPSDSPLEAERIRRALLKRGPNTLLWVRDTDDASLAGRAVPATEGLLLGFIRELPLDEGVHQGWSQVDLEAWASMCQEAASHADRYARDA